MENHHVRWSGLALVLVFWILLVLLRSAILPGSLTVGTALLDLAVIGLGAGIFWSWARRRLERQEEEIRRRTQQLEALHAAALALTTELDLGAVLQKVVDLSRELVHARYGALGVLAEDGEVLEQFITSGISPEQQTRIGRPPRGLGLLGIPIVEGKPIRIPEIARDPRAVGFPPHHPPMHSLLAVPVVSQGETMGNLYLADKIGRKARGGAEPTLFSEQDQAILERFATQAAIAIENARLFRRSQQLAVLEERERFGRDLHDGIIQTIYAIGLQMEDGKHDLETDPGAVGSRIDQAIQGLNDVIQDIRSYILHLRPQRLQEQTLHEGLAALTRALRADSFLDVGLEIDRVDLEAVSRETQAEMLTIAQEALTNVRKHARATRVTVRFEQMDGQVVLTVEDDGVGFEPAAVEEGNGLRNMVQRARALNGELHIEPAIPRGTRLQLTIPAQTPRP